MRCSGERCRALASDTLAHCSVARPSPLYCCDKFRWASLGSSEARLTAQDEGVRVRNTTWRRAPAPPRQVGSRVQTNRPSQEIRAGSRARSRTRAACAACRLCSSGASWPSGGVAPRQIDSLRAIIVAPAEASGGPARARPRRRCATRSRHRCTTRRGTAPTAHRTCWASAPRPTRSPPRRSVASASATSRSWSTRNARLLVCRVTGIGWAL